MYVLSKAFKFQWFPCLMHSLPLNRYVRDGSKEVDLPMWFKNIPQQQIFNNKILCYFGTYLSEYPDCKKLAQYHLTFIGKTKSGNNWKCTTLPNRLAVSCNKKAMVWNEFFFSRFFISWQKEFCVRGNLSLLSALYEDNIYMYDVR